MENKIQELTDKIYREGVEKGNEEAQKLIAKAQEEAKRIIEDARKEADSIVLPPISLPMNWQRIQNLN